MTRLYFGTGAFLVSKFIDISGLDHFSKISVSIHCFAVDPVQVAAAGSVELELGGQDAVLHAGDSLVVIPIFHVV
ncbi:MAG: hypothetical protein IKF55_04735, partial [Oscillospiraceae bacterium]|nr:hypothetical protein [Oscillospiraceae bacterium]